MAVYKGRSAWLAAAALGAAALVWLTGGEDRAVSPPAGALTGAELPAECRSELFREIAEISTHTDDPRLVQHADLLTRCNAHINANLAASNRARLVDRVIAPYEGLINFETPHVHPIDLTPDGDTVLAVNTAAATLEVFAVSGQTLVHRDTIAVGLDPVSVRARDDNEVWVVNQISDSVSVVDLARGTVVRTLATANEPADVVFAGAPRRAFVSASEVNQIQVFDLADLDAAPQVLRIAGEDPRALAVSPDGSRVYAAIFESSNDTFLSGSVVGRNDPSQADNDVAIVDANRLSVSYQRSLMNMVMGIAVNPADGEVSVVGTQAMNHIAREPNLNGIFVRVQMADFGASGGGARVLDLNPHLDYTSKRVAPSERVRAIGDPRGIAFSADGGERYVVGMGSDNLIVTDAAGSRLGLVDVGAGPTGLVADTDTGLAYVLNRFAGSISVVDLGAREEVAEASFYDPTPARINEGRVFVYNTHVSSGLGQASCGSCHVDARSDRLGWDLGDPAGATVNVPRGSNNTGAATGGSFALSPLKGVMVTQSLQDIMQHPSLHWRGDKADLNGFNGTFTNLMGADARMSQGAMDAMADYLATIWFPPNPYRDIDDSRPRSVTLPDGSRVTARASLNGLEGDNTRNNNCLRCHTGSMGFTRNAFANNEIGSHIMSPSLSGLYDKIGLEYGRAGFGFFHNGVADVKRASRFDVSENDPGLLSELLTLDSPHGPLRGNARRLVPHAGVGQQLTLNGAASASETARLDRFLAIAGDSEYAALIARARVDGRTRGFALRSGQTFDADRAGETATRAQLVALAQAGTPVTFTLVAEGTERRLALDLDNDGVLDGDAAAVNRAPTLAAVADQRSLVGAAVALQLDGADADGDALSYSATGLPEGLSLDSASGRIAGVAARAGTTAVTVRVSDGHDSASRAFDWVVESVDEPIDSGASQRGAVALQGWRFYVLDVDASIDRVRFELSGMDDDADLYVRRGARPTGHSGNGGVYDGHSDRGGTSDEQVELANSGAGRWHVGVYGWRGTDYELSAQAFDDDAGGETELVDGDGVADAVERGQWHFYKIRSGDGHTGLSVSLRGLRDDADLYVRAGARPSGHEGNGGVYDCGSYKGGTANESCELDNDGATTWYVGVYGYRASGYQLLAELQGDGGGGGDSPLALGEQLNATVGLDEWRFYTVDVPAEHSKLSVRLFDLDDDVDLYLRRGSRPSGSVDDNGDYDCGSYVSSRTPEFCELDGVGGERVYIGVHGYRASDFSLLARSSSEVVDIVELGSGDAASGRVEQGAWRFYRIAVNDPNNRLLAELGELSADIDLYLRRGQLPAGDPASGANSDCRSLLGGTQDERCEVSTSGSQTWYIGVYGYEVGDFTLQLRADKSTASSRKNEQLGKGEQLKPAAQAGVVTGGGGATAPGFYLLALTALALRRRRSRLLANL